MKRTKTDTSMFHPKVFVKDNDAQSTQIEDTSTKCRTCLTHKNESKHLFTITVNNQHPAEMINLCTQLVIVKGDGYPQMICNDCLLKLEIAYNFKLLCENSDKILKSNDLKTEDGDLRNKMIIEEGGSAFQEMESGPIIKNEIIEESYEITNEYDGGMYSSQSPEDFRKPNASINYELQNDKQTTEGADLLVNEHYIPTFLAEQTKVKEILLTQQNVLVDIEREVKDLRRLQAESKMVKDEIYQFLKEQALINGVMQNNYQKIAEKDFPIDSKEALLDIETKIQSDCLFKSELVHKISRIGGVDANKMARGIGKFLFKDSLLKDYSWTGTSSKDQFRKHHLITNCIFLAISKSFPEYTEHALAEFFKDYLRQAPARIQREQTKNVI